MRLLQPLHIHISTLFFILTLLVGGTIGGLGYYMSAHMVQAAANEQWQRVSQSVQQELRNTLAPTEMALQFLRLHRITWATSLQERMNNLGTLRHVLKGTGATSAVYVGYPNGDFFLLRQLGARERALFDAPDEALMMIQSIEHSESVIGRYIFLDAQGEIIENQEQPSYAQSYDPRTRIWWHLAQGANGLVQTRPYIFYSTQSVGVTVAIPATSGTAVVAADINLATLGNTLRRQKFTPGTQLALVNEQGELLAHERIATLMRQDGNLNTMPRLAALQSAPLNYLHKSTPTEKETIQSFQDTDGQVWRTASVHISEQGAPSSQNLRLLMAIPEEELTMDARRQLSWSVIVTLLIIALSIPLTWRLARGVSKPLRRLVRDVKAIERFDFQQSIQLQSKVTEIHELAVTLQSMQTTIQRFLELSMVVASEEHFEKLLPRLLQETIASANATAGLLYLADGEQLKPSCARLPDGTLLLPQLLNAMPAHSLPNGVLPYSAGPLLCTALQSCQVCSQALAPTDIEGLELDRYGLAQGAQHGIAIPLLNRGRNFVGAMVLLMQRPALENHVSFVAALSGNVAVSLEARTLIQEQKQLFEAFIQLIAGAIDAKSPYTGGHCARVPELTKMLAQAACEQKEGPFADFDLGVHDWEAVHVAAWLHDCGKVTTPEYVVDKATKLETIYDRIHEVRMRFEVLKRDAQISMYQAIEQGVPLDEAQAQMHQLCSTLDEEFAFVASCNQGGEYLAPELQARLQRIAQRTWTRTLDSGLGISPSEALRHPPRAVPMQETLLADKPEHRIERAPQDRLAPDNPWGFQITVPELLYNRGELHNLLVARGTLSAEERYKINEHMVQTIKMLTRLPFPRHLRAVPEIAGGHHEKMDGTGYPKGLRREDMSPVARMMAVADIFEALTAGDRPYKPGKSLSEALRIMAAMRRDQHIDADIFELFLRSEVYLAYAKRYMPSELIDAIVIEDYLT